MKSEKGREENKNKKKDYKKGFWERRGEKTLRSCRKMAFFEYLEHAKTRNTQNPEPKHRKARVRSATPTTTRTITRTIKTTIKQTKTNRQQEQEQ